ncbi:MAG: hypothetical protein QY309_13270 [Cyclobacteriaceae bacterium]|nr:MAG: hypothetical protein QY309_13270 [Cyclobacteriaceae bacterium]
MRQTKKNIKGTTSKRTKKQKLVKSRPTVLRLTKKEKELLELHKTLLLQIELVPRTSWFSNVRSNVRPKHWDKIRKGTYLKADNKCEICKGVGDTHAVECHEVWTYDMQTLTQRLSYFQAICPPCHEVKHIGLAGIRGNGERALNRFKEINQLDNEKALEMKRAVFKEWRIRSKKKWKLDIELLKSYDIDFSELRTTKKI